MNVTKIQDILSEQLEQDGLQRIIINGKWGIGKTWQIDQFCQKYQKNKDIKIIKLSLFGKKSVDNLNSMMFSAVDGKLRKFFRGALDFASKFNLSFGGVGANIPNMSYIIGHTNLKNKKFLVILDDFERKSESLSCKELFGFIDELCSNNRDVKVCLVMNFDQLEKKDITDYRTYFEKTFNKSFDVDSDNKGAVDNILDQFAEKFDFFDQEYKRAIKVHFDAIDDCNLRIFKDILCELQTYLQEPKLQFLQSDFDTFYLLVNFLSRVIYDCKTNKYFDEYQKEKNFEKNKDNIDFQFAYCYEIDDIFERRISAIARKCMNDELKAKYKRQIIKGMLCKYLYLDDGVFDDLIALHKKEFKVDNLFTPLFLCSDSEQISTAKRQYQYFLEKNEIEEQLLSQCIDQWYFTFDKKFIQKNLNPQKLQNHILDILNEDNYCLCGVDIYEAQFNSGKQFYEQLNKKIYEERIKMLCQKLKEHQKDVFSVLGYIPRYSNRLSKQSVFDKRLQEVFCKKNFFLLYLKNGTTEDFFATIKKFCVFLKDFCDEQTNQSFCSYIQNQIDTTTSKSFKARLENIFNTYKSHTVVKL